MSEQIPDYAAVTLRLDKLERQNRWTKIIVMLMVVVGLGGWAVRSYTDSPVTVKKILLESQEVKLVDSEGQTRFFMRLYSKVPILQLIGENGKPRMSIGLRFDDTPFIDLSDKDGETRAMFEMTHEDKPMLSLRDKDGNTTFRIN